MKRKPVWAVSLFLASMLAVAQGKPGPTPPHGSPQVHSGLGICARCIRAHEEFLASDTLRGRGSGTHDEEITAVYLASELRQYGIEPAGDQSGYLQRVPVDVKTEKASKTASQESASTDSTSWNVVGIVRGADPKLKDSVVLFSAHMDHLGVGPPVNGDDIYNGADDDASGVAAVLELARIVGAGARPRRTVIFAFFGSEEKGELAAKYFVEHPPVELDDIAVALEFEMIGRRDPAVKGDTLWLTGWERSNLGAALALHGAKLVADPRRSENFFTRSDNYPLAKAGVVAQTVSSFGLRADYHQPSDDLAHLDFEHLDRAIQALIAPIEWLVNSSFRPKWNEAGKP